MKIEKMVNDALEIKGQMKELEKTSSAVQRYVNLSEKRKEAHRQIKKHVTRYGVNPDNYEGLIAYQQETISASKLKSFLEGVEDSPLKKKILGMFYSFWKAYTR
jgi:hypothetical protein